MAGTKQNYNVDFKVNKYTVDEGSIISVILDKQNVIFKVDGKEVATKDLKKIKFSTKLMMFIYHKTTWLKLIGYNGPLI